MLQTVRLVGVAALAPEVNAAKNLVRLQPGSDAFKAALATLQQINGCAPAWDNAVHDLYLTLRGAVSSRVVHTTRQAPNCAGCRCWLAEVYPRPGTAQCLPGHWMHQMHTMQMCRLCGAQSLSPIVCRWDAEEADTYLRHLDAQRAVRSGAGWALDAGWLEGQGVTVPPALRALGR